MILNLTYRENIIGEILPEKVSFKTKEINGMLIPNDNYQQLRSSINKCNEIFNQNKSKNVIDRILDKLLRNKYKDLGAIFADLSIELNESKITNEKTEIRIIDNLASTGLGNPIIHIESWNLNTELADEDIETYEISYKYPSSPKNIIEIKSKGDKIREY